MTKRAAEESGKQAERVARTALGQLLLPMLVGIRASKVGALALVQQMGLAALQEILAADAEELAGAKGKRNGKRTHNHWGTTKTPLPFGGRHIVIERPRVRQRGKRGHDVPLPVLEELKQRDAMPERVVEQILLGVSTRGYDGSLERAPASVRSRGTSKSSASRHLIERTTTKVADFLTRRLDELQLAAMFFDGIEVAEQTVVIALGVTIDGTKVPLGLWLGSTENSTVCTALLQNLLDRGLRVDGSILCVIDGGKGIRKALRSVLGDRAVVQRCQVHKMRNVRDHLPRSRHPYVLQQMRDAYKSRTFKTARARLRQLASWLERNGEEGAAASLREGLDETLTVLRLGLTDRLCRTFSTTNAIENLNGTLRRVTRNVKRWRGGKMIRRWMALALVAAQRKFRRVKGHADMPKLVRALRSTDASKLAAEEKVA
jgi:putative transposase